MLVGRQDCFADGGEVNLSTAWRCPRLDVCHADFAGADLNADDDQCGMVTLDPKVQARTITVALLRGPGWGRATLRKPRCRRRAVRHRHRSTTR